MRTKLLLTILPTLLLITVNAQITFQKTFGFYGLGASVQQTADGGYIITGLTNLGANVFLIKTNSNGDTLWTKTFGGTAGDGGSSVQQTADGGYIITGWTNNFGAGGFDVYLIKTDLNGDTLWTKAYGGTGGDEGTYVQKTSDGGYVITGSTTSFSAGGYDVYLIKTDSIGDTLWTRSFGGTSDDLGTSVHQVADGGYMIVGNTKSFGAGYKDVYVIKTNSNGDTLWTKTYGGSSQDYTGYFGPAGQPTTDGGFIITGTTISYGAGGGDIFLIKINSLGDVLWSKTYGGTFGEEGKSVQQTLDGGFIIVGKTLSFRPETADRDIYLVKTDAMGDTMWTRVFGDTSLEDYEDGFAVSQTDDGGYIITGRSYGFGSQSDVYMIKIDSNGHSGGCYEYSMNTIVGNAAFEIGSGAIVGSGGFISSPATIVGNPTFDDSILCTSFVSIKEKSKTLMNVHIYPNPSNNQITIEINSTLKEPAALKIINLLGEEVYCQPIPTTNNSYRQQLNVSNYGKGIYLLTLSTSVGLRTQKIVIQ